MNSTPCNAIVADPARKPWGANRFFIWFCAASPLVPLAVFLTAVLYAWFSMDYWPDQMIDPSAPLLLRIHERLIGGSFLVALFGFAHLIVVAVHRNHFSVKVSQVLTFWFVYCVAWVVCITVWAILPARWVAWWMD